MWNSSGGYRAQQNSALQSLKQWPRDWRMLSVRPGECPINLFTIFRFFFLSLLFCFVCFLNKRAIHAISIQRFEHQFFILKLCKISAGMRQHEDKIRVFFFVFCFSCTRISIVLFILKMMNCVWQTVEWVNTNIVSLEKYTQIHTNCFNPMETIYTVHHDFRF